jgi:membrane-associated phospholipid phosphatase
MKLFFSTLPRHVIECFRGRMLIWHLIAILLTALVVVSGFDWQYFLWTRSPTLLSWVFPAVPIGGLVPIALPLALFLLSAITRNAQARVTAWAVTQAEIIGGIIAAGYKALTGRAHPAYEVGADITHVFRFGLLRGGVFWGWPSSHTTIAFAMAATVFTIFPKQRWLGFVAVSYAAYVGLGVSMTIHWFSDFAAGAIIGSVVGVVVGRGFLRGATKLSRMRANEGLTRW